MASERDIVVDVTIRSDTKGADKAGAALGDVDKAAGKTGTSMKGMGSEAEKAGKSMQGMGVDAKSLEKQIAQSKETIKGLQTELTKVGNNPGLRKSLTVEKSWLSELEKISKDLLPDLGKSIQLPTPKLDPSALSGAMMPALIGLAAAASPAIGAIVAGAVVGGVGLGGIAGGVFAASHNDAVKGAWADFTKTLTADSFGAEAFVQPVIQAIHTLEAGVQGLHIGDVLAKGAAAVPILADGLIRFANGVMPGVSAAMDHADEIATIFGDGLSEVGYAVGKMIKDFSESEGAMQGLALTFDLIGQTIGALDLAVTDMADTFHKLAAVTPELGDALAKLWFWLPPMQDYVQRNADAARDLGKGSDTANASIRSLTSSTAEAAQKMGDYGQAAQSAADYTNELVDAWRVMTGQQVDLDQAMLNAEKGLHDIEDTFKDGTKSVQGHSEAVLENRNVLEDQAAVAVAVAQAYLRTGGTIEGATAMLAEYEARSVTSTHATGAAKEQVQQFADSLFKLPASKEIEIFLTTHYRSTGFAGQIANATQDAIATIAGALNAPHRAAGGSVMAGVPYTINERGSETVTFPAGGTVHPANLSPMTGGGGSATFTVLPGGSDPFVMAMVELFRRFVSVEYGGNVQSALGRG